ncbi:MAG: HAD domain-containing protein [Flavobacterium sp.]|nr:HAD domain-containing protein [Flavobacterium sp.]
MDIDGVLNHHEGYKSGTCKYEYCEEYAGSYQRFEPHSKKLLNELIQEFDTDIVISSTWRSDGIDRLSTIWKNENMNRNIIGITPIMRSSYKNVQYCVPRGFEIEIWLKNQGFYHINWSKEEQLKYCKESNIDQYLILDDDSDMLYSQRNNFVHIR